VVEIAREWERVGESRREWERVEWERVGERGTEGQKETNTQR
jgi:hypothetical protein